MWSDGGGVAAEKSMYVVLKVCFELSPRFFNGTFFTLHFIKLQPDFVDILKVIILSLKKHGEKTKREKDSRDEEVI